MSTEPEQPDFTDRQRAVLDKALELLVEGGEKALTTAAIARAAGCSKESLYKWFGDRDGLLAAIVTRQASKVIPGADPAANMSEDGLRAALEEFARNLLETISGDVSLALNRLAIGQASKSETGLGAILEKSGRARIGRQTTALLEKGCTLGYLHCEDPQEAYSTLYGWLSATSTSACFWAAPLRHQQKTWNWLPKQQSNSSYSSTEHGIRNKPYVLWERHEGNKG